MTEIDEKQVKVIEKQFTTEKKIKKLTPVYPKTLKVKFRSRRDCERFALLIQRHIDISEKIVDFKIPKWRNHGKWRFTGEPKIESLSKGLKEEHASHWKGMPDFEQDQRDFIFHELSIRFSNANSYAYFANLVRQ
jgi:hypothetical protein